MLYSNMISVTNAWVGQGKLSPGIGLWGIHAVMLAITALMFYRRMAVFSLRRILVKKRPYHDLHTQRKGAAAEKEIEVRE